MNILVIEDDSEARSLVQSVLERHLPSEKGANINFVHLRTIQDAIELLEKQEQLFDLIVFAYSGTGQAMVKYLLQHGGNTAYIMCAPDHTSERAFVQPGLLLEVAIRAELEQTLLSALGKLEAKRSLGNAGTPDSDFIPLKITTLLDVSPIKNDVYIRLAPNRYLRLLKRGTELAAEDIKKFRDSRRADALYLKKSDADSLMDHQVQALKAVAQSPNLTDEQGDRVSAAALSAVKDIVERVGFTPQAQSLAKQSVEITLKLIGSRPKLSQIIVRLNKDKDRYIASHSIILGKIACALAHKVGWNSAATYLKLTLAAFLHDLPFQDNTLASYQTLDEVKRSGKYNQTDIQAFKMHPIQAAEYARQFHEIPGDVDQILLQHHERPDGSGFPRGLGQKYITPLATIFIMAHDLLDYMLEHPEAKMDDFFLKSARRYTVGTFRKLFKQLTEGEPTN